MLGLSLRATSLDRLLCFGEIACFDRNVYMAALCRV